MSHDLRPLGSSVVNNRFSVKLASSCFTSYWTAGQNGVLSSTDALIKSQSDQELHLWGLGACPAGKATSILLAEPVEEASELTLKKDLAGSSVSWLFFIFPEYFHSLHGFPMHSLYFPLDGV